MPKYLLLLEGNPPGLEPAADDTVTQSFNQRWMDWVAALVGEGKLAAGGPLAPAATEVTNQGAVERAIQPVDVYGFLLLDVASLDEATEIAGQAPNVQLGGAAVVRPVPDVGL